MNATVTPYELSETEKSELRNNPQVIHFLEIVQRPPNEIGVIELMDALTSLPKNYFRYVANVCEQFKE